MFKKGLLLTGAALAISSFAAPAAITSWQGAYASLGGGWVFSNGKSTKITGAENPATAAASNPNYRNSDFGYDVTAGYRWNTLGLNLTFTGKINSRDGFKFNGNTFTGGGMSITCDGLFLGADAHHAFDQNRLLASVGGGLGLAKSGGQHSEETTAPIISGIDVRTKTAFAYQINAGLDYRLAQHWFAGVKYMFMVVPSMEQTYTITRSGVKKTGSTHISSYNSLIEAHFGYLFA